MSEYLAEQRTTSGKYCCVLATLLFSVVTPGVVHTAPIVAETESAIDPGSAEATATLFSASQPIASGGQAASIAVQSVTVASAAPVNSADIAIPTTAIDIDSELRAHSRELFATLTLIAAQYAQEVEAAANDALAGSGSAGLQGSAALEGGSAGIATAGDNSGYDATGSTTGNAGGGGGSATASDGQAATKAVAGAIAASRRLALERFIMGDDTNATISLQPAYASRSPAAARPEVTRQMKFEYWSEPTDSSSAIPIAINIADASASQSFLHRMLCMVGLVSPEAAGLDEDCDYR